MTVATATALNGESRAFSDPTYVPRNKSEEIAKRNGELLRAMMHAVPVEGRTGFPKEGTWRSVIKRIRMGRH